MTKPSGSGAIREKKPKEKRKRWKLKIMKNGKGDKKRYHGVGKPLEWMV